MSTTRPGEMGRLDAQKIAQETAALMKIAGDERGYREHVLVSLARLEVKFDGIQETLDAHIGQDEQRFGSLTQKVGDNSSWINKGIGMCVLLLAMIGVIMWIIDRSTP